MDVSRGVFNNRVHVYTRVRTRVYSKVHVLDVVKGTSPVLNTQHKKFDLGQAVISDLKLTKL